MWISKKKSQPQLKKKINNTIFITEFRNLRKSLCQGVTLGGKVANTQIERDIVTYRVAPVGQFSEERRTKNI